MSLRSERPAEAASLRLTGEACSMRSDHDASHPTSSMQSWASAGGWCENAGKVSCGSDEIWRKQESAKRTPPEVRAAIVAMKPGNAGGAKGGRKANLL